MLNPVGFLSDSRLLRRIPLSQDTGILFRSSKIEFGLINQWSPADELFGVACNFEPIAVFNILLTAGIYENYRIFGFGYRSLSSKTSSYHDTIIADIPQENQTGLRITVAPSLKIKIGPLIVANNLVCTRVDMFNTQEYFYDIRTALPHYSHDVDIANDLIMLYEWNSTLLTGIDYTIVRVVKPHIQQQKLGLMAIATPSHKKLSNVFLLLTGGVYLESRYRNHTPYVAALGGFEIPLFTKHRGQTRSTTPLPQNSSP